MNGLTIVEASLEELAGSYLGICTCIGDVSCGDDCTCGSDE